MEPALDIYQHNCGQNQRGTYSQTLVSTYERKVIYRKMDGILQDMLRKPDLKDNVT